MRKKFSFSRVCTCYRCFLLSHWLWKYNLRACSTILHKSSLSHRTIYAQLSVAVTCRVRLLATFQLPPPKRSKEGCAFSSVVSFQLDYVKILNTFWRNCVEGLGVSKGGSACLDFGLDPDLSRVWIIVLYYCTHTPVHNTCIFVTHRRCFRCWEIEATCFKSSVFTRCSNIFGRGLRSLIASCYFYM